MEKIVKIVFVGGLFLVALFPFSLYSALIEPSCFPDSLQKDQTCPFCSADGAEWIHLRWDVPVPSLNLDAVFSTPTCVLNCKNSSNNGCKYGKVISTKDIYNFPSSNNNGTEIGATDDIYLPRISFFKEPKQNDIYQVSCTYDTDQRDDKNRLIRETKISPKMIIGGCNSLPKTKVYIIEKFLARIVKANNTFASSPAQYESLCHYKLTTSANGVVIDTVLGTAAQMALATVLPRVPEGAIRIVRLFGDNSNVCKFYTKIENEIRDSIEVASYSSQFGPNPGIDIYFCDSNDDMATTDPENYWANCRGYGN